MLNSLSNLFGRRSSSSSSNTASPDVSTSYYRGRDDGGAPPYGHGHGYGGAMNSQRSPGVSSTDEGSSYPPTSPEMSTGLSSVTVAADSRRPRAGAATTTTTTPPPPRVKHTLARIKQLVERINPELVDTLSYPASRRSVAELQSVLRDYIVPRDVLEAYSVHDGQDTFSVPRTGGNEEIEGSLGFVYGLWWMSIDEIIEEYHFWRRLDISTPPSPVAVKRARAGPPLTASAIGGGGGLPGNDLKGKGRETGQQRRYTHTARAPSTDAFLFGSEMDPRTVRGRMRSCPQGFVREEYSHPAWLPILKDGYGNYIGVDLDPPPLDASELPENAPRILPGRGQVIAFGREVDTKTVLWNGWVEQNDHDANIGGGWARFLATFADDLSASSQAGRSRRSRINGGQDFSDDDDEASYRTASGGRQEGVTTFRRSTGLEWMEGSPVYSGMGTIEALVERSKQRWASIGLFHEQHEPSDRDDYDGEMAGDGDAPSGTRTPYASRAGQSLNRPDKPAPLTIRFPPARPQSNGFNNDETTGDGMDGNEDEVHDLQGQHDRDDRTPMSTPLRHSANPKADESQDGFVDIDPISSTTALVTGMSLNSKILDTPASPEPSLILSPPSPPRDASHPLAASVMISPLTDEPPSSRRSQEEHSTSSARKASLNSLSSPTASPSTNAHVRRFGGGGSSDTLQSPSRMSPNQAARQAEKEAQRRRSSVNSVSSSASTTATTRRMGRRPPPPPAAPLGLPTLEFGYGLWETHDHATDMNDVNSANGKDSFEVVIDRQR